MTISSAGLQGIQSGVSLLNRAAANVAASTLSPPSSGDEVSLSADAVAFLQARNAVGAGVAVVNAESNLEKALLNVSR